MLYFLTDATDCRVVRFARPSTSALTSLKMNKNKNEFLVSSNSNIKSKICETYGGQSPICFATALNLDAWPRFENGCKTINFPFSSSTLILCLSFFSRFSPYDGDESDLLDTICSLFFRFDWAVFFVDDECSESDAEVSIFVLTLSMCLSSLADLFIAFRFK